MKRSGKFCLAMLLGLTAAGMAQKAAAQTQTQLFDDFMGICINTNAQPDMAEKTLATKGIMPYARSSPPDQARFGGPMWSYRRGVREYLVQAGTMHEAATKGAPADDAMGCTVSSNIREDKSFAAMKTWVGIPPLDVTSSFVLYNYYLRGTKRIAFTVKDSPEVLRKVSDEGNMYLLSLGNDKNGTSFSLMRITTRPGP